jgi:hypothetical protein
MEPLKIKCKDCSLQVTCSRRDRKENYEKTFTSTFCKMAERMRDKPRRRDNKRSRLIKN